MHELIYIFFIICFILLVVITIHIVYPTSRGQNKTNEYFIANSNLINQAPMNFSYLTNPNYARNILDTYYLNDDTKINGTRVINHPYMYSRNKSYGYYSVDPVLSNNAYKEKGVRL
jgi:hypothetical protein